MMTREMEFRMERAGLIQVGDQVRLKEDAANTMAGVMYYYTIRDQISKSSFRYSILVWKETVV